jgi:hypothetical protein
MPVMSEGPLRTTCAHAQADRNARDRALPLGASERGTLISKYNLDRAANMPRGQSAIRS